MFKVNDSDKLFEGYTFIDLFCGIGGFHLALSSLGAKCVFASDINKAASEVYYNNFGIKPQGDIKKITCAEIPSHDILCAGFPCQPFSISGSKKGFNDPNGKLFFDIIRIARFHKPKVILLENVKNLEKHDDGETLKTIIDKLDKVGYRVFCKVLNSADYGVPQSRKRIYIVAFKKSLKIKKFIFPEPMHRTIALESILEKSVSSKYYINREYEIDAEKNKSIEITKKITRIGQVGLGRQGERIYSIKGQAITLSSQGGGLAGKTGMYLIDNKVRRLSPRECARAMGFPDDFKISSLDSECYSQFGNSVVVNVIQEISKQIAINMQEVKNEEH